MDGCSKLLLGDAVPISPMTNDRSERKGRFIYSGLAAGHIYSRINYLLCAIYFVIAIIAQGTLTFKPRHHYFIPVESDFNEG